MKKIFNATLVMLVTMVMSLVSCTDNLIQSDNEYIGEGEASVTLDFSFEPQGSALEMRGVNGNLDFQIRNLVVLFYEEDADEVNGSPKYAFEYTSDKFDVLDLQVDGSRDQDHCENYTYHGMVTIKGVEYGKYRIYAVANVDIEEIAGKKSNGTEIKIDNISEKELRELQIKWPTTPTEEEDDDDRTPLKYGVPDAMFGYFTLDVDDHVQKAYRNVIHHNPDLYNGTSIKNDKNKDKNKDNNRPKAVTLNKRNLQVQAWLKRVVSKLTIGFDGTGLKSDVEIYIKSVRIMDAAESCLLGHDNSVYDKKVEEKFNNTDKEINFLNNEYYAEDLRLYTAYESDEEDVVKITRETPAYPRVGFSDYFIPDSKFNKTDKDEDKDGWVDDWYNYIHGLKKEYDPTFPGPTYKNLPTTLYFFENLQGIGTKNNSDYDKSLGEEHPNYKDGKPNGTYVEVKAYYKTTKTGKESQGDITYRFMLGKNITNDFNVERNHHYKLILSFIGDANNVDWHIDYEEEKKQRVEGYYFRIPYNIEEGASNTGYIDKENEEKWFDSENWNLSWVWYAYDENNIPIAEVVKEMVYYDENDKTFITKAKITNGNVNTRDYYQVVTVYPMIEENGKYVTDLANGIIAQVWANDKGECTKKADGTISMIYRYKDNQNNKSGGITGAEALRGYYTITSLSWGDDEKKQRYDYVYVNKDVASDSYTLELGEEPRTNRYETGAYQVKDTDGNYFYPVVKIGSSYWTKEDLRTTHYSTEDVEHNTIFNYSTVEPSQYDFGAVLDQKGYIGFNERYPMYKEGDNGGLLYNYFALAGVDAGDYDGKYTKEAKAEPYYDLFLWDDYHVDAAWLKQEEARWNNSTYFYPTADYFSTYYLYAQYNLQISPAGWHIPTCSANDVIRQYTGLFREAQADIQYLQEYIGNNWIRVVENIDNITNYGAVKIPNLTGLSLNVKAAKGTQISYDQNDASQLQNGRVIPFWTDLLQADPEGVYKSSQESGLGRECSDGTNFYPNPPYLNYSEYYGGITMVIYDSPGHTSYYSEAIKLYLPIRCVRHSFTYEAPAYNSSNSRFVKIIKE